MRRFTCRISKELGRGTLSRYEVIFLRIGGSKGAENPHRIFNLFCSPRTTGYADRGIAAAVSAHEGQEARALYFQPHFPLVFSPPTSPPGAWAPVYQTKDPRRFVDLISAIQPTITYFGVLTAELLLFSQALTSQERAESKITSFLVGTAGQLLFSLPEERGR